jgi:AcrR family transcriptional regulator
MPKRSPEYMKQQRLRFCEAAMACFGRNGVVGTSINDICEEAGLSMGALYKHFAGRDELLEAVLELRFDERTGALHGRTWPEMRSAILGLRQETEKNPFWHEFMVLADRNERLREFRIYAAGLLLTQVMQQIRHYADAGEIVMPFELRQTAQLVSIIFDGSHVDIRATAKLRVSLDDLALYLDHAVGAQPGHRYADEASKKS